MPAPMTRAVSPPLTSADAHRMQRYGDGFEHGGFGKGDVLREPVEDTLRDGNVFGKGAVAAVIAAGDADDLAVVAEVDFATRAVLASAAIDG